MPSFIKKLGFVPIPNEIAEAFMKTNLNCYQSRVVWAIIRKTWGFNKKEDWLSNSQLVRLTGIRKQHISRTLKTLKDRYIVSYSGNKIRLNEDFSQWKALPKKGTVTNIGKKVTSLGSKVTYPGKDNKHYTRNNITRNKYNEESQEYKLSELLLDLILDQHPGFRSPDLQEWADDIRKMFQNDGRKYDEIEAIIYWSQKDDFWKNHILSAKKLREKFDQLYLQAKSNYQKQNAGFIS